MARKKRSYGTGELYIENGSWYGRWWTPAAGAPTARLAPPARRARTPA